MIQDDFTSLIHLYQRDLEGNPVSQYDLVEASFTFMQQLKAGLQGGSVSVNEGRLMIQVVNQYTKARQKKKPIKAWKSREDQEKEKQLNKELFRLTQELFVLLNTAGSHSPQSRTSLKLRQAEKSRKRQNRMHKQQWVRS